MTRAAAVRLSLSAIVLACTSIVLLHDLRFWAAATLPVEIQQGTGGYMLHPLAGMPLPAPLADGDVLAPREMTPAARAVLLYGLGVPAGSSVAIAVRRGGRMIRGAIPAQSASPFAHDWLRRALTAFFIAPFLAALALLTLWRGHDRVAVGLGGVSVYALMASALLSLSNALVEPLVTVWLVLIVIEAQYVVAIPALYVMAEALAGSGMSPRTRTGARAGIASLCLAAMSLDLARQVSFIRSGVVLSPTASSVTNLLTVTAVAIPVLVLLGAYRKAPHESRLRIRWVLWSTAFLFACILGTVALAPVQSRHPYLFEFTYTVRWFAFAGYLYAAIKTRLVDVSFVINRAVVYATITGLLFGIFSVLELGLHDLAVGDKLSWALQALAAMLLAVALSPLHRRLEHSVERLFFRKQRLAIASLRTFAAECAFIEQQSSLLDAAVVRLHPHCDAVALYERALSGYQLRASRGRAWPEAIDVDDPGFVSLRAHRQAVDLHGLASVMGPDSTAFPMVVGETLSGAVVCRPRAGERFAPDVRAALGETARNIGASLYILRYREQARLVADIATGRIDETGARRRAVAMLEGGAA